MGPRLEHVEAHPEPRHRPEVEQQVEDEEQGRQAQASAERLLAGC